MDAVRKFAFADFLNQQFPEYPPAKYGILTIDNAIIPAASLSGTPGALDSQDSRSSIEEIAHIASLHPALLLVKVPFEPPTPVHKFYADSGDLVRLTRIAQIDICGLGLVSNDTTGFHCLAPGSVSGSDGEDKGDEKDGDTPASYYLYCGAYKLLWSYDARRKCTKAIAFMFKSGRGLKGFEDFTASLRDGAGELVMHPLFIPLLAGMETVAFMEKTLRGQYDKCRIAEKNSGVHPWRVVDATEQQDAVRELADMARQMTALVVEVEMVVRRLRQWKLALGDFTKILGLYQAQGYHSTSEEHGLVSNAISLSKSKLEVMEIDFLYVKARAKNQVSAMTQIMSRDDTLASIDLARSAARDGASMKVVAIMTMAFLPGTFFAALFAVPSLRWDDTKSVIGDNFWIYWAFTLPLTVFVFVLWMILTQREELAKLRLELFQQSMKRNAEGGKPEKETLEDTAARTSGITISSIFSPVSFGYLKRTATATSSKAGV